jgi:hypothetical protein
MSVLAQTSIGVLGDIEGNYKRFESFIKTNGTLYINELGEIDLVPGKTFVFMGDAIDHGSGGIRFTRALTNLKERYPDRVKIILGNRDLNKMKIYHFLKSLDAGVYLPDEKYIYDFLLQDIHGVNLDHSLSESEIMKLLRDRAHPHERLESILKGFGAPGAFKYHREELKLLNPRMQSISRAMVYKHYMASLAPGGTLRKLLSIGQLIAIVDGNLFTHGAITERNHGQVPGHHKNFTNTREWVTKLNDWLYTSVEEWKIDSARAVSLDKYQKPDTKTMTNVHSVVYGRYSDSSGNPKTPRAKFLNNLKSFGIYRIFVGHTPTGDFPILLRHKDFEIVLTDSSHSKFNSASKISVNGKEVTMNTYDPIMKQNILVKSNIHDNYKFVGMHTKTGMRIIGEVQETGDYLLTKVIGGDRDFKTTYKRTSKNSIKSNSLIEMNVIMSKKHPCTGIVENIFLKLK